MTSCDGSMCTSEARSRTAWVRMLSTTWTTGAFSVTTGALSVSTSRFRDPSTASKACTSLSTLPMA